MTNVYTFSHSSHVSPFFNLLLSGHTQIPFSGYLLLLHFYRRLYESVFVTRSRSSMSIFHYFVGLMFYALVPIQFIISNPLSAPDFDFLNTISVCAVLACMAFQHISFREMSNLRQSETAPLHTCPPPRGLFCHIMSPQYLYEILLYLFLIPLVGFHFIFPFIFTLVNQSVSAYSTLQFYKQKFPEEVGNRKALIPFIF
jgi:3-oxo-5-alpha-steroid 4-dehydrogenase 3